MDRQPYGRTHAKISCARQEACGRSWDVGEEAWVFHPLRPAPMAYLRRKP